MKRSSETIPDYFNESLFDLREGDLVLPVYTKPLHEVKFLDFCGENGIAAYLPLRKEIRIKRRSYGAKQYEYQQEVYRPMFASYVFARLNAEERSLAFKSDEVLKMLRMDESQVPGLLRELRVIRKIEIIGRTEELEFNADIKEGEKFLIESGAWEGVYGWLKKKERYCSWVVEIECVNTLVRATIDPSKIKMSKA